MRPNVNPIKCSKKRVLTECKVVVEAWPSDLKVKEPYSLEHEFDAKERYAEKLQAFFEHHLDMGVHNVHVECDYEEQCSHCGDTWHETVDNNGIVRCDRCGNEMEVER